MERTCVVGLLQNGQHGQLRGVSEQARRPRRVPHAQHRRRRQRRFERVEALLLGWAPRELGTGAAEGRQRGSEGREAQDEFTVGVDKTDEAAHVGKRRTSVHDAGVAHSAMARAATLRG